MKVIFPIIYNPIPLIDPPLLSMGSQHIFFSLFPVARGQQLSKAGQA